MRERPQLEPLEPLEERPAPTCCRHEPPYPGAGTIIMDGRDPAMTVHDPTDRCSIQEPHLATDCGECFERVH